MEVIDKKLGEWYWVIVYNIDDKQSNDQNTMVLRSLLFLVFFIL